MRIRAWHTVFFVVAAVLAGCSAGSSASTASHPVTNSSRSVETAARATATAAAMSCPSRGLLGVLPVPAGATPWPTKTLSLISFVKWAYTKRLWTEEEALNARRGFVCAVVRAWTNADGSGQSITLVRFAALAGTTSAFDEVNSFFKQEPKPATMLADPAINAVGYSDPTLDSDGNATVEFVAAVGDTMIIVVESTAATPDPAAAKALLQDQYDSVKNGS